MDGVEQEVTKGCRCGRNRSCGRSVESNRALLPLIHPRPVLGPSVQRMKVPVKGTDRDPADVLDVLMMRKMSKTDGSIHFQIKDTTMSSSLALEIHSAHSGAVHGEQVAVCY